MRKGFIFFIILFSMFLSFGCTESNKGQPATPSVIPVNTSASTSAYKIVNVSIQSSSFNPSSVEISSGNTVKWVNMDSDIHKIKGDTFESTPLTKGDVYEHVFTKPGVYDYTCSIHPSMKGTITVTENK